MEYEIILRPEAEKDLTNAFIWYEDKPGNIKGNKISKSLGTMAAI